VKESGSRLRLIEGGQPDKPKRKRKPREQKPWECRVCETDIGTRTRTLVKVRHGAFEDGELKVTGGSDHWACAMCMARGKLTLQTA
jgi:hypothetical protein